MGKTRLSAKQRKDKVVEETIENIVLKAKFLEEFDVEYDEEFTAIVTIELDVIEREIMAKGFAIICYNVGSIFSRDYTGVSYELFYGDYAKGNKILSKDEAMALIEIHELELVINNKQGKVWE